MQHHFSSYLISSYPILSYQRHVTNSWSTHVLGTSNPCEWKFVYMYLWSGIFSSKMASNLQLNQHTLTTGISEKKYTWDHYLEDRWNKSRKFVDVTWFSSCSGLVPADILYLVNLFCTAFDEKALGIQTVSKQRCEKLKKLPQDRVSSALCHALKRNLTVWGRLTVLEREVLEMGWWDTNTH